MKPLNIFWIGCGLIISGGLFADYSATVLAICTIFTGVLTILVAAMVIDNKLF